MRTKSHGNINTIAGVNTSVNLQHAWEMYRLFVRVVKLSSLNFERNKTWINLKFLTNKL